MGTPNSRPGLASLLELGVPTVRFTAHLREQLPREVFEVASGSVGEALDEVFREAPQLKDYLLDNQGAARHHVALFIDGKSLKDRKTFSDSLGPDSELYVMQALSGG